MDIERIEHRHLTGLSPNGIPCEACHGPMHSHVWVDMDPEGFVVDCSNLVFGEQLFAEATRA